MNWVWLVLDFAKEFLLSTLRVARLILSPRLALQPAILAVPLRLTTDAQITLLSSMITLTPGTLSVDVSDDRKLLYIHVLDAPDHAAVIGGIVNGFEEKVLRAWS